MSGSDPSRPKLDRDTVIGLLAMAAIVVGVVCALVAVITPHEQAAAPANVETVWDAPSQGFFNALSVAGLTLVDDRSKQNILITGNALCARFAKPQANKQDIAEVVLKESPSQLTQLQAMAIVDAANVNLCPSTIVPAVPVPIFVPNVPNVPHVPNVPNVPNVPSPPRVSDGGGGGGGNGGESRFCRRHWWC